MTLKVITKSLPAVYAKFKQIYSLILPKILRGLISQETNPLSIIGNFINN